MGQFRKMAARWCLRAWGRGVISQDGRRVVLDGPVGVEGGEGNFSRWPPGGADERGGGEKGACGGFLRWPPEGAG
jgi:hypothetical protein